MASNLAALTPEIWGDISPLLKGQEIGRLIVCGCRILGAKIKSSPSCLNICDARNYSAFPLVAYKMPQLRELRISGDELHFTDHFYLRRFGASLLPPLPLNNLTVLNFSFTGSLVLLEHEPKLVHATFPNLLSLVIGHFSCERPITTNHLLALPKNLTSMRIYTGSDKKIAADATNLFPRSLETLHLRPITIASNKQYKDMDLPHALTDLRCEFDHYKFFHHLPPTLTKYESRSSSDHIATSDMPRYSRLPKTLVYFYQNVYTFVLDMPFHSSLQVWESTWVCGDGYSLTLATLPKTIRVMRSWCHHLFSTSADLVHLKASSLEEMPINFLRMKTNKSLEDLISHSPTGVKNMRIMHKLAIGGKDQHFPSTLEMLTVCSVSLEDVAFMVDLPKNLKDLKINPLPQRGLIPTARVVENAKDYCIGLIHALPLTLTSLIIPIRTFPTSQAFALLGANCPHLRSLEIWSTENECIVLDQTAGRYLPSSLTNLTITLDKSWPGIYIWMRDIGRIAGLKRLVICTNADDDESTQFATNEQELQFLKTLPSQLVE